jgi:hypothetical protein
LQNSEESQGSSGGRAGPYAKFNIMGDENYLKNAAGDTTANQS